MQWLKNFTEQAKGKLAQFNNNGFKNAVMAVCALVAAADGSVEPEERSKVAALIAKNELLSVFNPGELRDIFLAMCDKAGDEFERIDLLNHVRKLGSNAEQADTALKIALIIANSDGDFAESEKKVVREICGVLKLPMADYNV